MRALELIGVNIDHCTLYISFEFFFCTSTFFVELPIQNTQIIESDAVIKNTISISLSPQLKTVMERCEKIPAETFESRSSRGGSSESDQQRLWPSVDREGKSLGDAEYVVPSPPERESLQAKTLSPADLEAYVRSYQDPQVSQVMMTCCCG